MYWLVIQSDGSGGGDDNFVSEDITTTEGST